MFTPSAPPSPLILARTMYGHTVNSWFFNCSVKSEFNVEIPRLFLCFVLRRPMWLNKRSVSALPWGITRVAFASFANVE